ncbi:MAG TPA: hypothetical protein VI434_05690 [Candidatus Dormibacteraeota bacterium]
MTALDGVEIGLGVVLTAITLFDVFQSVVFPRPSVGRVQLSVNLVRLTWRVWRAVAQKPHKLQTREAALAAFAPLAVVGLLVLWGLLIIIGYALIFSGLHNGLSPQPDSFGTTLFFSAGRMLAFSVGGIEANDIPTRILTSLEAATGFGLFALVISLLFSLFSAFQRREAAVVALDAIAGAPASGLQLLETCAKDDLAPQLAVTFDEWRVWSVDVLETHLTYPLLFFFRSSHDNEAWANSFGAVMDAAVLVISTIDGGPVGHARLLHKVGSHLVADMRHYYYRGVHGDLPGVERDEFVAACDRLQRAGYRLRDTDEAWKEFSTLRGRYAPWLNEMTKGLAIPPAPWIGDRSYLPHRERGARRRP